MSELATWCRRTIKCWKCKSELHLQLDVAHVNWRNSEGKTFLLVYADMNCAISFTAENDAMRRRDTKCIKCLDVKLWIYVYCIMIIIVGSFSKPLKHKCKFQSKKGRTKRKHYSQSTVEVNAISSNFRGLIETPSARKFRIEFVRLGDAMTTHTTTLWFTLTRQRHVIGFKLIARVLLRLEFHYIEQLCLVGARKHSPWQTQDKFISSWQINPLENI